ncbi:MAG: MFS transporter [Nocardioides sp.]
MTWRESFAPLRNQNFAWYFASRFSNTLGTMMASIALTFAVLDLTDSTSALGQVLAARTIPMVLFLLFGGVIADRFPRTLVIQLSNVLSALTQGMVAYLVLSGQAELWMLLALEFANGSVSAVSFPAMQGLVPSLVERSQLQSANALLSLVRGGLTIIGPTIGALLVVTVGSGWALAVDAVTWLLAALLMMPMQMPARPRREQASSTIRDLREGWSLFIGTTWLWVVVLAFSALNMIHAGAWFTLGPAVAKNTIGEQGWGLVLSAESVGLVLMTLILLRVRIRRPLLVGMLGCSLLSVPLTLLGVAPHLVLLIIATFVAGAGIETFGIGWTLAMQENIEDRMMSRAFSYDALGSFVAMPVGQLLYGPLGEHFGSRDVLLWSGIAYAAIALLTLSSRSVRKLERQPSSPAPLATTAA